MAFGSSRPQRVALFIFVVLAFAYLWYSKGYLPLRERIKAKSDEYEMVMSRLIAVKLKAESYEQLKREYETFQARYKAVELLLPSQKEVPAFLQKLHEAAGLAQISISQIDPQPSESMDFYQANPYSLKLEGSYHRLGKFLSRVANFPFIVNVSRVSVVGQKNEGQLAKPEDEKTIRADLWLTTYNLSKIDRREEE